MHLTSELFVGRSALEDLSLSDLNKLIVEQRQRPKLPTNLNKDLTELIKACWVEDPEMRPEYSEILEKYSKIDFDSFN